MKAAWYRQGSPQYQSRMKYLTAVRRRTTSTSPYRLVHSSIAGIRRTRLRQ